MKAFLKPILGALIVAAAPAWAAEKPPAAAAAEQPAKLGEAHAIIEVMFPPAEREKMVDKMLTDFTAPMRNSLSIPSISDPGLKAIFQDFFDQVLDQQRPLVQKHMPALLDAMAVAYTHEFSLAELKDIHAFALTPSGRHYFSHAATIVGDPAVAKVNLAMMTDAQEQSKAMIAGFKDKVVAYLKAHPDVAAKMQADAATEK